METYVAYCAACDAEVEITPAPDPDAAVSPDAFHCLESKRSCGRDACPAAGLEPERLRAALEFLPPREGAPARSFEEAPHRGDLSQAVAGPPGLAARRLTRGPGLLRPAGRLTWPRP